MRYSTVYNYCRTQAPCTFLAGKAIDAATNSMAETPLIFMFEDGVRERQVPVPNSQVTVSEWTIPFMLVLRQNPPDAADEKRELRSLSDQIMREYAFKIAKNLPYPQDAARVDSQPLYDDGPNLFAGVLFTIRFTQPTDVLYCDC